MKRERKARSILVDMVNEFFYERKGEFDPDLKLIIIRDQLGDISIGIYDPNNREEPIRKITFATLPGGGKSMNVLHALPDLALAMEKDNQENSDYR